MLTLVELQVQLTNIGDLISAQYNDSLTHCYVLTAQNITIHCEYCLNLYQLENNEQQDFLQKFVLFFALGII